MCVKYWRVKVSFYDSCIRSYRERVYAVGEVLNCSREVSNPYDDHAIRVVPRGIRHCSVGCVPRSQGSCHENFHCRKETFLLLLSQPGDIQGVFKSHVHQAQLQYRITKLEIGELNLAISPKNRQPSNLIPCHIFCLYGRL